jgi:hypothetical protein
LTLLALFFVIAGSNWALAIRWWTQKKRSTMIPFVGGVFGFVALLISPWKYGIALCWLPLVVDIGCGAMLIGLLQGLTRK